MAQRPTGPIKFKLEKAEAENARLKEQLRDSLAENARLKHLETANRNLARNLHVRATENDILRAVISDMRIAGAPSVQLIQNADKLDAFPNASTTGAAADADLSAFSGSVSVGDVIEGKRFTNRLTLKVDNVTVRNCVFDFADGVWLLDADGTKGLVVENCTFRGQNSINSMLTGFDAKVLRCDISGVSNGITLQGGSALVEGNYIHDLNGDWVHDEPHIDGVSVQGTLSNVVIRNNTIISWDTSGVFIKPEWGPISNILVQKNLIRRQEGQSYAYAIYSEHGPGGVPENVVISDNVLERGTWGFFSVYDHTKVTLSGNVDLQGNHIG